MNGPDIMAAGAPMPEPVLQLTCSESDLEEYEKRFIGWGVSVISKSEIRYEGTLVSVGFTQDVPSISLDHAKMYGTEGRPSVIQVPPQDHYQFVVFRSAGLKHIQILAPPGIPQIQTGFHNGVGAVTQDANTLISHQGERWPNIAKYGVPNYPSSVAPVTDPTLTVYDYDTLGFGKPLCYTQNGGHDGDGHYSMMSQVPHAQFPQRLYNEIPGSNTQIPMTNGQFGVMQEGCRGQTGIQQPFINQRGNYCEQNQFQRCGEYMTHFINPGNCDRFSLPGRSIPPPVPELPNQTFDFAKAHEELLLKLSLDRLKLESQRSESSNSNQRNTDQSHQQIQMAHQSESIQSGLDCNFLDSFNCEDSRTSRASIQQHVDWCRRISM